MTRMSRSLSFLLGKSPSKDPSDPAPARAVGPALARMLLFLFLAGTLGAGACEEA